MKVKVLELEGTREECSELLRELGHAHKHVLEIPEKKNECRPFGGRFARMAKNTETDGKKRKGRGWSSEARERHRQTMRDMWVRRKSEIAETETKTEEQKKEKGIFGGLGL